MSNLKWADVAHYYQGISAFDKHGNLIADCSFKFGGICTEGRNMRMMSTAPINEVLTPILRALEDMTEGEARELYKLQSGMDWEENGDDFEGYAALQGLTETLESHGLKMGTDTTFLSLILGEPQAWSWLISKGFDVFGLIESGQAIRKGVENG